MSEHFATGATLNLESAKAALSAGLAQISAGASAVDCAPLMQFDSSALAVLIAWQRAARERGVILNVLNLPTALASLARAYGVDSLLHERH
ncbi:STAS domain-containing protein [Paraburkholderia sacchari]|uniref:STAS domain-containing protein n=1 Tax=Paraburkholderia sacchari TaxID=159450 RepID=UPI000542BC03|nr:STAS domain-containing protein [Paraburkholderia sacchari]NLP65308.1 STAS domain-containing protein [Paraburkholderia sacchari]